jgi:hypothetical protein
MVNPSLHKTDNTALVYRLNKTFEVYDAWFVIYDVAVLDETLDGTLLFFSSLTKCKGVGAKTAGRIVEAIRGGDLQDVLKVPGVGTRRYESILKGFPPVAEPEASPRPEPKSEPKSEAESEARQSVAEPVAEPEPEHVGPSSIQATFWNLKKLSNTNQHKIDAIVKIMKLHPETDIFFLQEVVKGDGGEKAVTQIVQALNAGNDNNADNDNNWAFKMSGRGSECNEHYAVIWKTGRLGEKTDDYPKQHLTFQNKIGVQDFRDFFFGPPPPSSKTRAAAMNQNPDDGKVATECFQVCDESLKVLGPLKSVQFKRPIWRVSFGENHYAVHHTCRETPEDNKRELLIMQTLARGFSKVSGTPIYIGGDLNIGEAQNLEWSSQQIKNILKLEFPQEQPRTAEEIGLNCTNFYFPSGGAEMVRLPSYNDNVMSTDVNRCEVQVLSVNETVKGILTDVVEKTRVLRKKFTITISNILDHKPITLTHDCH